MSNIRETQWSEPSKGLMLVVALLALSPFATQAQWQRVEEKDPMTDKAFTRFILSGKFLQAPRNGSADPVLVVLCEAKDHKVNLGTGWKGRAVVHGSVNKAFFNVGAVVGSSGQTWENGLTGTTEIVGSFRRDEDKAQRTSWSVSTSWSGLMIDHPDLQLRQYLYYRMLYVDPSTEHPQTKRLLISVDEYLGTSVVMEFDLGDASEVADACGLRVNEKKGT